MDYVGTWTTVHTGLSKLNYSENNHNVKLLNLISCKKSENGQNSEMDKTVGIEIINDFGIANDWVTFRSFYNKMA